MKKQNISTRNDFTRTITNTHNTPLGRCEVAKSALCSEDVKTAALPPCEVPLPGNGCVTVYKLAKPSQIPSNKNTPLFWKEKSAFNVKSLLIPF